MRIPYKIHHATNLKSQTSNGIEACSSHHVDAVGGTDNATHKPPAGGIDIERGGELLVVEHFKVAGGLVGLRRLHSSVCSEDVVLRQTPFGEHQHVVEGLQHTDGFLTEEKIRCAGGGVDDQCGHDAVAKTGPFLCVQHQDG